MMYSNSSTFSSDRKTNRFTHIKGIIFAIFLFFCICNILNYIYVPDDEWYRILFHYYYDQVENIDNVFVGSSHVFCGINPEILDELNGKNNFNMSTDAQRWDNTYYLMKDVCEKNNVEHVFLECYYWCMIEHTIWDESTGSYKEVDYIDDPASYSKAWLVSSAMRPSYNRFAIQNKAAPVDCLMETMIPFVRYRENLFSYSQIRQTIQNKQSNDHKNYVYHEDKVEADGSDWCIEYYPKGYYYSSGRFLNSEKRIRGTGNFFEHNFGNQSLGYLRRAIEYCQKNNIAVTLFVSPMYDLQILSTENYDNYVLGLERIAIEYGVDFYDFNLIKDEYLNLNSGDYFMDSGHLNCEGTQLFTPAMWEVFSGSLTKAVFYDSYKDKLAARNFEIYGLYFEDVDPGESVNADGSPVYQTRRYHIAANRTDVRYRVVKKVKEESNAQTVQNYTENAVFDLPVEEQGTIYIEAVHQDEKEQIVVNY